MKPTMQAVKRLMKQVGTGFLATTNGRRATVRPMSAYLWIGGDPTMVRCAVIALAMVTLPIMASAQPQRDGASTWAFSTKTRTWRKLEFRHEALDNLRSQCESLRLEVMNLLASCRNRYHRTELPALAKKDLAAMAADVQANIGKLLAQVSTAAVDKSLSRKVEWAKADLTQTVASLTQTQQPLAKPPIDSGTLRAIEAAERSLMRARDALSLQPPPRLLPSMVYDPTSGKIVLFGGDRGDHLCAETWLYDPKTQTWEERRPALSPTPRAASGFLYLPASKKLLLLGGYTYVTSMSYCPGQYEPLPIEAWTYDVAADKWQLARKFDRKDMPYLSGGCWATVAAADATDTVTTLVRRGGGSKGVATYTCRINATSAAADDKAGVSPGTVTRRGLEQDPDWFEDKDVPPADVAGVEVKLKALPANKWLAMLPPKTLNDRCWGTQIIDPDRDQIIHWTGGHSSHCGTNPAHYSLQTNRWSTQFAPELPMESTYDAGVGGTSPAATFSGRPFLPHTYKSYAYDPATRKMLWCHGNRTWVYDLDRRDWETIAQPTPFFAERHGTRLCATSQGIVAWAASKTVGSQRGLWLLKDLAKGTWEEILAPSPDKLPPFSSGDSHAMAYDRKRDRLMFLTAGVKKDAQQLYLYDMKSRAITVMTPNGAPHWPDGAGMVRELCYLPDDDLALICSVAKPSPVAIVFDPVREEWLKADIQPADAKGRPPVYPDGYHVSLGLMWNPKRKLIWASDVRGGVFVLRFDRKTIALTPLE